MMGINVPKAGTLRVETAERLSLDGQPSSVTSGINHW
jgi:hypothetical protein